MIDQQQSDRFFTNLVFRLEVYLDREVILFIELIPAFKISLLQKFWVRLIGVIKIKTSVGVLA